MKLKWWPGTEPNCYETGQSVIVPPTHITQSFLNDQSIKNMEELGVTMPRFQHTDVAMTDWMPLPPR